MVQKYADVDAYLADLEPGPAAAVRAVRGWVHEEIAGVEETIAYNMATFTREGRSLLHLAGWRTHLAIYPEPEAPADDPGLVLDLAPYASGKGTLRFGLRALDEPLVRRTLRALGRPR
ncbi:iron chaperone [Nocardioides sp. cx-173]|uniref:iron chaperone n=1 Tax=Nocardioides sp. cx-173 TaxID=2898796 RepID=UPI001E442699|nr:DUF1801 domain-containing protein [Nocardioides sp. cx-173]MCD4523796.1 hypothetical protein [Nocardioides sp. cx-173]UGB41881.1 hypothetical protein LQ940_21355 [Nocardioides sp. cx-173]